jgi:hypothetical protein
LRRANIVVLDEADILLPEDFLPMCESLLKPAAETFSHCAR